MQRIRIQRKNTTNVPVETSSGSQIAGQASTEPSSKQPFRNPAFAHSTNRIPIHAPSAVNVQREAAPEEEDAVQTMRNSSSPMVQREAALEEEEAVQTMRNPAGPVVQRDAAEDEEVQTMRDPASSVQREAAPEEDEQMQAQAFSDSSAAPSSEASVSSRIQSKLGGGQNLDSGAREFLEPRFGQSFDHVRIHADSEADALSKDLGARAFTTGQDIFFRSGEYQPASSGGQHLLAHELTHTIQQAQGPVDGVSRGDGVKVSDPGDRFEQEAESNAASLTTMGSPTKMFQNDVRSDADGASSISTNQRAIQREVLSQDQITEAQGGPPQVVNETQSTYAKLSLVSDQEANDIGHAWITIESQSGTESFGFWPKSGPGWFRSPNVTAGKAMSISCEGEMRSPDTTHSPNAVYSKEIDIKGYEKAVKYAHNHANSRYQLALYNCSTFARGMYKAGTGIRAPSAGVLFDSPNDLADRIHQLNRD
jgi:hypothetical protein